MLNNVHALANWQYFVVRGGGGGGVGEVYRDTICGELEKKIIASEK